MIRKQILILISLIGLFAFITAFTPQKINEREAIKRAEAFVKYSGYTNATLDTSMHKLTFELIERTMIDLGRYNIDSIVRHRHNSLHPKAYYISYSATSGWHVGFLSTMVDVGNLSIVDQNSDLPGRCVILYSTGTEIRMAHKSPLFSHFKKL